MRLANKVALVTGAGSGIGAASARHMAGEGAAVALVGIPADGVEEGAAALRRDGYRAVAISTDVADAGQVESAVQQTVEAFGRLDIAVTRYHYDRQFRVAFLYLCEQLQPVQARTL